MSRHPREFRFWHQRLDVFRVAIRFVRFVESIEPRWFRGSSRRRLQLSNAADSIALNIAEGSSQTSTKARQNHHRIALGSTGECDALLEILEARGCPVAEGRKLLSRLGAMLSRMTGWD